MMLGNVALIKGFEPHRLPYSGGTRIPNADAAKLLAHRLKGGLRSRNHSERVRVVSGGIPNLNFNVLLALPEEVGDIERERGIYAARAADFLAVQEHGGLR